MEDNFETREWIINGIKLECIFCKSDQFWTRKTLMNTPGFTFMGLDWANKTAQNFICENCGFVHWFLNK